MDFDMKTSLPIVTTDNIVGYKVTEVKGLVWSSSVKSKSILKDIMAMFRIIWGGNVDEYWELIHEARHEILLKLNENTKEMGANAVISLKLTSSQIVPGTVEVMAYGTAVVVEKEKK